MCYLETSVYIVDAIVVLVYNLLSCPRIFSYKYSSHHLMIRNTEPSRDLISRGGEETLNYELFESRIWVVVTTESNPITEYPTLNRSRPG